MLDSLEEPNTNTQQLSDLEKQEVVLKSWMCGLPDKEDVIEEREDCEAEADKKVPEDTKDSLPLDDEDYNMAHPIRGDCLIFVNKKFKSGKLPYTKNDIEACTDSFQALGFTVTVHKDLLKDDLLRTLKAAGEKDRTDDDALVVIFSSHGNTDFTEREVLCTYDGQVDSALLWAHFMKNESLAGKPKLFFIDACRGGSMEKTVKFGRKVVTDSSYDNKHTTAPVFYHPDMLVMNSSYAGMQSMTGQENDFKGSKFLQMLCRTLQEEKGSDKDLSELLQKVTRRVGVRFKTQLPQTSSTLTKRVRLW